MNNFILLGILAVSIILNIVLVVLLYNKENFCNCYGMQIYKQCPDPAALQKSYEEGKTEYQNFDKAIPSWNTKMEMPYDKWEQYHYGLGDF